MFMVPLDEESLPKLKRLDDSGQSNEPGAKTGLRVAQFLGRSGSEHATALQEHREGGRGATDIIDPRHELVRLEEFNAIHPPTSEGEWATCATTDPAQQVGMNYALSHLPWWWTVTLDVEEGVLRVQGWPSAMMASEGLWWPSYEENGWPPENLPAHLHPPQASAYPEVVVPLPASAPGGRWHLAALLSHSSAMVKQVQVLSMGRDAMG